MLDSRGIIKKSKNEKKTLLMFVLPYFTEKTNALMQRCAAIWHFRMVLYQLLHM